MSRQRPFSNPSLASKMLFYVVAENGIVNDASAIMSFDVYGYSGEEVQTALTQLVKKGYLRQMNTDPDMTKKVKFYNLTRYGKSFMKKEHEKNISYREEQGVLPGEEPDWKVQRGLFEL